jgi:hypothetical protein
MWAFIALFVALVCGQFENRSTLNVAVVLVKPYVFLRDSNGPPQYQGYEYELFATCVNRMDMIPDNITIVFTHFLSPQSAFDALLSGEMDIGFGGLALPHNKRFRSQLNFSSPTYLSHCGIVRFLLHLILNINFLEFIVYPDNQILNFQSTYEFISSPWVLVFFSKILFVVFIVSHFFCCCESRKRKRMYINSFSFLRFSTLFLSLSILFLLLFAILSLTHFCHLTQQS